MSASSKGWFTLRHKHKHKHKHKHNECSHLLHKHKELDIRKRNELQNEAAGVLDELRFQNGGRRRNSPAAIARTQLNNVHLPVLTPTASATSFQQSFFLFVSLKSSEDLS